ncbi:E3 ubiquitin-protein ligase RNF14-like [Haliotis cracherodii]|uniref:E3 ubiquitin-protein ligase RNF14-like n=1 Tax=Haliotis cracherodii TaxID=6455 RepID=UPI0039EAB647
MAEGGATPTFKEECFDSNLEEQNDEVLALQSIYEGGEFERLKVLSSPSEEKEGFYTLHISIPITTDGQNLKVDILMPVKLKETASSGQASPPEVGKCVNFMRSDSGQRWVGSFNVKYLPPLSLQVVLPATYPSQSSPVFTLSCVWLTANQLAALCGQLDVLWQETENLPVIFTWVDWLENNIFSHLGIHDTVLLMPVGEEEDQQDHRALPDCTDLGQAVSTLLQFSQVQTDVEFYRSNHECHVCYEELPGNQFYRMKDCEHHYCRECITAYCEHHVTMGTVENLRCPDTDCDAFVPPNIVQSVLPADEFDRWERLMLQKSLERMSDVVWCPRCNNPVIREEEDHLNLGHCTTCFFSFCTLCRDPWHQGEPCQTAEDKLNAAEKKAPNASEADRKRLEAIKKKLAEELKTKIEMSKKSRQCPVCTVPIEKIAGCNKMTCRCGKSFCWLCGKLIVGYDHFSSGRCGLTDTQMLPLAPGRELPDAVLLIEATLQVDPDARKRVCACPTCGQRNLKNNRNNHIKCWGCKSNFCFLCRKRIVGSVTSHFTSSVCEQHS